MYIYHGVFITESRKVLPFIMFVVAMTNSTFESSCCDRKRSAEIWKRECCFRGRIEKFYVLFERLKLGIKNIFLISDVLENSSRRNYLLFHKTSKTVDCFSKKI